MAIPKEYEPTEQKSKYTMNSLKKDGDKVKIRIMSDFILGKFVWGTKDDKPFPYRVRPNEQIQSGWIGTDKNGKPNMIKQFLAAVVYNYTNNQTEIFDISKITVIDKLQELEDDEDWGDLKGYDLTLSRSGEGFDTTYSVIPSNKKKYDGKAIDKVNLELLFSGEDPFSTDEVVVPEESSDVEIPF